MWALAFWVVGIFVWVSTGNAIGGVGGFFGGALLGLVAGGIAAYAVASVEDSAAKDAAEQKERENKAKERKQQQAGYRQEIAQLGEHAIVLFEKAPAHLTAAEDQLCQAEQDFAEGVFAPFWDSVERAANSLGRFDQEIRAISDASARYTELVKVHEGPVPQFPLSASAVNKLTTGANTAKHMRDIVRRAQRDFHFSTIYEQRKTNQILVAGFTNLAQALDQMTSRITSSIDNLSDSVQTMGSTLNESIRSVDNRLGDIQKASARNTESAMSFEAERNKREQRVVEMLDNIQRRRKPAY